MVSSGNFENERKFKNIFKSNKRKVGLEKKMNHFLSEYSYAIKFLGVGVFKYSEPSVNLKKKITGKLSFEKYFFLLRHYIPTKSR